MVSATNHKPCNTAYTGPDMSAENINFVETREQDDEVGDLEECFPLDALPPILRKTAEAIAYAYNAPEEIVASSILPILGF